MARAAKLKVFRIPIGFHDAYVAAPSQKAAVAAWGTDKDVFSRGVAEIVTDPDLIKEPLAKPGTIVKRLRASPEGHLAALPARNVESSPSRSHSIPRRSSPGPKKTQSARKLAPQPSRAELEVAETALEQATRRYERRVREIRQREAALIRDRAEIENAYEVERKRLDKVRERAAARYTRAMKKWRSTVT